MSRRLPVRSSRSPATTDCLSHRFLSKVRPNGVPANSVYVTLAVTCLLALIIIGSTTAFNIILSVSATGLFTSYLTVISTMLAKRIRRESFLTSRFNLGVCRVHVNIIAICFLVVAFFFLFFWRHRTQTLRR